MKSNRKIQGFPFDLTVLGEAINFSPQALKANQDIVDLSRKNL
jgi:hypothetical protein